jgi:kynurenine formamidase
MCVPACHEQIVRSLSRRSFLKSASMVTAAGALAGCTGVNVTESPVSKTINYNRIVDLTHTLREDFPTYFGPSQLKIESLYSAAESGFNLNQWTINEHTGTDTIPVSKLVGALAVIDIRARATENADAQVTPDDIKAWESVYGPLPAGAIVAMNSGWDAYVMDGTRFRNADDAGVMHFPGFHLEAIDYMMEEKDVVGIMSDTLSLDFGPSPDFAAHFQWLPSNRWGIESVANLSELPVSGATVMVGVPKIAGASGGPSRVLAFAL